MGRLERIVLSAAAAGILVVSLQQGFEVKRLRTTNTALRQEAALLERELQGTATKSEEGFKLACGGGKDVRQRGEHLELFRLRGEVGVLRRQLEERKQTAEAQVERVEIQVEKESGGRGPRVQVSYDPAIWKRLDPSVPSEAERQRTSGSGT